jgi:putative ABC transport system permease protein
MRAKRIYKALLHCYPAAFRNEYGSQMLLMFAEQLGEARRSGGSIRFVALWLRAAVDALVVGPKEHAHVLVQDLRYTLRSVAASPGFSTVAILSLTMGIGANTAIFTLRNQLLHSPLPGVQSPRQLVMLTNPEATGSWTGMLDGERPWLTFEEFEDLRDRADTFSSLMAVQSYLDTWQVRSANGGWDEARGRFVSGRFFDVLGVHPALGRVLTEDGGHASAAEAVISYDYWQRRFGGRADVLGKAIAMRNVTLTVIGVAPPGFIGETVGQQPDLWVPLSLQPAMRAGEDWLHDRSPNKNMWLHVFGRLKPGVNRLQAEAQANEIFKAGLESFYGTSPGRHSESLRQNLRIHVAEQGVSAARGQFSNSLTALLASVGVLLLIACANLANLLLARGAARRPEIALRLSLGASRGRLIRQLVTESLLLALTGGLASIGMAYLVHGALARMMAQSDRDFRMNFSLDPMVLGFTLTVTIATVVLFGLLPAWQATRADAQTGIAEMGVVRTGIKEQSCAAVGWLGFVLWGRLLVSLQLALSLPLLVSAGLLARTLYNLRHVDLGYRAEGLVVARVDTDSAGYDAARRNNLYRDLREQLQRIPGVRAATYSGLGLFSGTNMSLPIEVEGYRAKGANDRGSGMELIGPAYFSTLGVPMERGRGILEGDDAGTPQVCVINAAFAKQFFAGRNAIGMHVTAISHDARTVYRVVGVAKDARTQNLRASVRPRVFVPWPQAPVEPKAPYLLVRADGNPGPVLANLRRTIQQSDPSLPINFIRRIDEQIGPLTAQDRSTAQLAEVFGCSALLLAAIGLYGLLSYRVARRRTEIAIRVALGAQAGRVVAMILGDTVWLVGAGLALGAGLSYAASRWIKSQLFGVAPQDPATLAWAVAVLIAVALSASYVPARKAASLEPMSALRRD